MSWCFLKARYQKMSDYLPIANNFVFNYSLDPNFIKLDKSIQLILFKGMNNPTEHVMEGTG